LTYVLAYCSAGSYQHKRNDADECNSLRHTPVPQAPSSCRT
jgi:hypothetical protein